MTIEVCHAELGYATRAFALRKLFNAALACLGHQHLINFLLENIMEKKFRIIAISREFGSGGRTIGQKLSEALKIQLF